MKETEEVALPQQNVYLVGADYTGTIFNTDTDAADKRCLAELAALVTNLDMAVCGQKVLRRSVLSARFGIGTGQAADIIHEAKCADADHIVFDFDITPTQLRNWEKESGLTIYDRQGIIILIFASRAQTREAVLQVELAKLEYALPRLAHTYLSLSRQRGGSYGSKGAGESKLELDRREIQDRIIEVKKDIAQVRKIRAVQRRRRSKTPVPLAALVGYTNAGKSSLLNALTRSDVMTKDALFATLDPSTRRLSLQHGMNILISDTVGFIKNLPHSLIEAFHATLEEAVLADMLLIVLDAADPDITAQYETTLSVLREINADNKPIILVLNKADKLDTAQNNVIQNNMAQNNAIESDTPQNDVVPQSVIPFSVTTLYPDAVLVSAATGNGLDALCTRIVETLPGTYKTYDIPLAHSGLVSVLYGEGCITSTEWCDTCVTVTAKVPPRYAARLAPFARE